MQTSKKYQVENSKATHIWESNTVIHYKPGLETHCFKRCDVVSTVQQKEMLHCPGIKPGIKLMCNRFTFFLGNNKHNKNFKKCNYINNSLHFTCRNRKFLDTSIY